MSRAVIALGFVASALAQTQTQSTFVRVERDTVDLVQMQDKSEEQSNWATTAQERISEVEKLASTTTKGVELAAPVIARVDALVEEVAGLKISMKKKLNGMRTTMAAGGDRDSVMEAGEKIYNAGLALEQETQATRRTLAETVGPQLATIEGIATEAQAEVDEAFEGLESLIDDSIKTALESAPFYGSDNHIKQVTGIDVNEWADYWDGKPVKSNGQVQNVAGRLYYKVKFNLNKPGWFSVNTDELIWACRALSVHLRRKDGKERDLRPVCNHHNRHGNYGGQGACAYVHESYFSHCGGGGYWRPEVACGGAPEAWLRGSLMWEDLHDGEDRVLRHDEGPNRHSHKSPFTPDANSQTTICTSANDHYKV